MQLYDLYSSPNIIWVITSRRIRWVGHAACIGVEERCIQVGKPEGKEHLEDPSVDRRII